MPQRKAPPPRRPYVRHDAAWRRKRRRQQNAVTLAILALILLVLGFLIFLITRLFSKPEEPSSGNTSSSGAVSASAGPSSAGASGDEEPSSALADMGRVARTRSDLSSGDLILVNFDNSYEVEPPGLVSIAGAKTSDYGVKNSEIQLRDYVIPYLNEMMADFRAATGIGNVVILSSYRSVEYQRGLYEKELARTGKDYSDEVTKPGYSEHHTGLTIDLAYIASDGSWPFYDGQGDYGWINENSWKYGFIVRYPENKSDVTKIIHEPWHFRFLGPAHAEMVQKSGLCYEEYMEMLKKHPVTDPYTFSGDSGSYTVYYVPLIGDSAEVPVPKDKTYTISGSNEGGFIVTVTES